MAQIIPSDNYFRPVSRAFFYSEAALSRNSSGTYSVPITLIPGTTARASDVNEIAKDAGDALTDSLSRSGQGGMLAPFRSVDGSASQPGMSFTNDPDTGFRRSADGSVSFVSNGVDVVSFGPGGVLVGGQPLYPAGDIKIWASNTLPSGWLWCDGSAVSRETFPALFTMLGTAFGAGNGTTTFNLPDFRGRVPAGRDNMGVGDAGRLTFFGAVARTLAGVLGSAAHVLSLGQMPSHNHPGSQTDTQGNHSHALNLPASGLLGAGLGFVQGVQQFTRDVYTNVAGAHAHNVTVATAGSNEAHTNAQPTIIVNYIIRSGV